MTGFIIFIKSRTEDTKHNKFILNYSVGVLYAWRADGLIHRKRSPSLKRSKKTSYRDGGTVVTGDHRSPLRNEICLATH